MNEKNWSIIFYSGTLYIIAFYLLLLFGGSTLFESYLNFLASFNEDKPIAFISGGHLLIIILLMIISFKFHSRNIVSRILISFVFIILLGLALMNLFIFLLSLLPERDPRSNGWGV